MSRPQSTDPTSPQKKYLSRFYELKSCSYVFQKKCFQVDQQHIVAHRRSLLIQHSARVAPQKTVKKSSLPCNRPFALWRSDQNEKRAYILKPAVVVGRGVLCAEIHRGLLEESEPAPAGVTGGGRGLAGLSGRHDVTACFKSLVPVGSPEMLVINYLFNSSDL